MQKIYFDNAATTPLDKEVVAAMLPYLQENFGNPSSIYALGRETRNAIEQSRKIISGYLNTSPSEIFFTSGGTESSNFAIRCTVRDLGIKNIISSRIEHHCVLDTVKELGDRGEVKVHYIKLTDNGHIDLGHLEVLLTEIKERCLVSLMNANNEIGNLMDIKEAGEICRNYDAIFHSDTVQTVGHYKIDLQDINIHFMTGSGHKFHGPKGAGFVYVNSNISVKPLLWGGSQERNMRAGTENLYGIVGLGKAFELANENMEHDRKYIQGIKDYMINKLEVEIPDVRFNGDYAGNSLYTVLNVSFPPTEKSELLLFNLDIAGIYASSGSACTAGAEELSHVIQEIQHDPDRVPLRFSFSKHNNTEEVDIVAKQLKSYVPSNMPA